MTFLGRDGISNRAHFTAQGCFSRPPVVHQRGPPERIAPEALRALPRKVGGRRGVVPRSKAFGVAVGATEPEVSGTYIYSVAGSLPVSSACLTLHTW